MVSIEEIRTVYTSQGLTREVIALFRQFVYDFYEAHKRSFPWRDNVSDYGVFISEIMLQQTQAPRVVEKYVSFIKRFPSFDILASASLREVLEEWQGLGYNRRAKMLKEAAEVVVQHHKGALPQDIEALDALPGIGYATACSISAFAFNKPVGFIETNIRSVFLHTFFFGKEAVSDADLMPLINAAIDLEHPREWYSALMDYGTFLKKEGNPSKASKHYTKQSSFKNSTRELRGKILRTLLQQPLSLDELTVLLVDERLNGVLEGLVEEGLILKQDTRYLIV